MNHSTPFERQQRLFSLALGVVGQTVIAVLFHGRFSRLREVGFEFNCGDRNSVDEQHQINRQLARGVVLQLGHHTQDVGSIPFQNVFISPVFRSRLRQINVAAPSNWQSLAQHLHSAVLVQCRCHFVQKQVLGSIRVVFAKLVPFGFLGRLQPRNNVLWIQGSLGVVVGGLAHFPAQCGQLGNDVGLEVLFLVGGVW